jgi:glycosylphosphatidylinositol transamidase (GPIT) subunit GPI8
MRIHLLLSLLSALTLAWAVSRDLERDVGEFYNSTEGGHTNNWAVLVCTSRYWFNYRVRWIEHAPPPLAPSRSLC